jgi:hypothetical protein
MYTSSFLTPKDYNLHFRHITHRGLITRVRMNESNKQCRFCGAQTEHILHLGGCPTVIKILRPFLKLTGQRRFKYTDILFAFPDAETEGIKNIIILAWKFIIRHFYQDSLTPVAFTDCKVISKLILGRFAELALGWSQRIKRRIYTNACSGASAINTQKCSRMSLPLATISLRGDLIYEPATLDLLKKYDLHRYIPHPRRIT